MLCHVVIWLKLPHMSETSSVELVHVRLPVNLKSTKFRTSFDRIGVCDLEIY